MLLLRMVLLKKLFNKIIWQNRERNIKLLLMMKNDWGKIRVASGLSDDTLRALDASGWRVAYRHGEHVVWEGDEPTAIYFVRDGLVEIYRTAMDGREHTLGIILPGQGFNLVPALRETTENPASARCVKASTLLAVSTADVRALMGRFPDLALAIAGEMAERLENMVNKAGGLALQSVRQRLAVFLIAQADAAGVTPRLIWTRDEMARQIGTVRDVIVRNLKRLEDEGVIQRDKGNIVLLNKEKLQAIASGEDAT
jgi:CRP/FNR family transcriptional regulator